MIKIYLKFPPIARKVINISISGLINGIGVDYYRVDAESFLLECNKLSKKFLV